MHNCTSSDFSFLLNPEAESGVKKSQSFVGSPDTLKPLYTVTLYTDSLENMLHTCHTNYEKIGQSDNLQYCSDEHSPELLQLMRTTHPPCLDPGCRHE